MADSELALELAEQWRKDLLADRSDRTASACIIGASIMFASMHLGWQIEKLTDAIRDIGA